MLSQVNCPGWALTYSPSASASRSAGTSQVHTATSSQTFQSNWRERSPAPGWNPPVAAPCPRPRSALLLQWPEDGEEQGAPIRHTGRLTPRLSLDSMGLWSEDGKRGRQSQGNGGPRPWVGGSPQAWKLTTQPPLASVCRPLWDGMGGSQGTGS